MVFLIYFFGFYCFFFLCSFSLPPPPNFYFRPWGSLFLFFSLSFTHTLSLSLFLFAVTLWRTVPIPYILASYLVKQARLGGTFLFLFFLRELGRWVGGGLGYGGGGMGGWGVFFGSGEWE